MQRNENNLYLIQDNDCPMHVAAKNYQHALQQWQAVMLARDPGSYAVGEPLPEPEGISFVSEACDLILPGVDPAASPAAQEAPDGSVTPAMWQKMHHEIVDRLSVMSDTPEARKMMFEALYSSERVAMSLMQPAPASATERDAAVEELREIAQVLAPHAGRHDEAPIDTLRALMRAHPSGEAKGRGRR